MKKVFILSNHHIYTYNFRKEIIEELIKKKYEVTVVLPYGEKVENLKRMGCKFIDIPLDRRGINPLKEIALLKRYYSILKTNKPDIVISYTAKPNIYGSIVCNYYKIPIIANITGLGTGLNKNNLTEKVLKILYKFSFRNISHVFFQNEENKHYFKSHINNNISSEVIPGSGVNIDEFSYLDFPENEITQYTYMGRIMKNKGINELIEAFKLMNDTNTQLNLIGFIDDKIGKYVMEQVKISSGRIVYQVFTNETKEFYQKSDVIINASYHEGMSNLLLEAASSGRPLLASNISGCKEIISESENGFLFESHSIDSIVDSLNKMSLLSKEKRKTMGQKSREKIVSEFNRKLIVNKYIEKIEELVKC